MDKRAHAIVVGNEKGGTGKSTVSMHLVASLLDMGLSVGSVDLDARQATLSRYIENRRMRAQNHGEALQLPDHQAIPPTTDSAADEQRLRDVMTAMLASHDVVVIDTPGSDHPLSRMGHSYADTLVTPLNDSFIDLDVLAKVDPETMHVTRPSHYSEMVWETKKQRALRGEKVTFDWVVLRNRLSHVDARNKRDMERLLAELARRVGFRLAPGLGERVIYKELFLDGLTLVDLGRNAKDVAMRMSHIAARQELRVLVEAVGLHRLAEAKVA